MSDIYKILDNIQVRGGLSPEYCEKMVHEIPKAQCVDRAEFVLGRCKDKVVLHIGCIGPLHAELVRVAGKAYGIDREPADGCENFYQIDLDRAECLPELSDLDLVLCGEMLEHLSNPGHFLDLVKAYGCDIIITVPNAFSAVGFSWANRGTEIVNREHVAWYSWHTLKTLVERHGYHIKEFYWYGGKPIVSEGLIVVMGRE